MARPRKGTELGRTESLTIRITPDLRSRIKAVATETRLPTSELVHRIIEVYLDPEKSPAQKAHDYAVLRQPTIELQKKQLAELEAVRNRLMERIEELNTAPSKKKGKVR